ncbi:MAG: leucine--tRNA ligase [Candidatus Pacebacteria bacterium]|nr:leucine--tRNA ligase [Candidatus Paceibacterota bacterium]MBP9058215.1 leucine--tRNA ligase [Candidatus Paceibacterota bacterium]MBP9770310.1 leucine--tRNA ligase [Candidatus Paceibacterota bacterium]
MNNYDHKNIESKWQKKWIDDATYKTAGEGKPKQFILDMFPYPSGEGLHVGHPRGYIATDVYSRMKRMQGFDVLHPMGWDAFGLPAENFAIKNKVHPSVAVEKNIARFKEQLSIIGLDYDWSREINTTDPEFYKWTQWIFLQMFKKGLAYESYEPINWCPSCQTGLANEDVEADGTCERCGTVVEKKPMRQWVLKITDYADRLLADLDKLPKWPNGVKEAQRHWIGRSEGSEIGFRLEVIGDSKINETITVFTTRADTLFGVTYIVLAPEHRILESLKNNIENWGEIEKYIAEVKNKSELDRTNTKKEKTGVQIKGIKAINPANGEAIPVWIADYVLASYGTGAVMAVPAHDERDFEFAKKYNLQISDSIADLLGTVLPEAKEVQGSIAVVYDERKNKFLKLINLKSNEAWLVGGGKEEGETFIEAAIRELKEEAGFSNFSNAVKLGSPILSYYFNNLKNSNRKSTGYAYLFFVDSGDRSEFSHEEHESYDIEFVEYEDLYRSISETSGGVDNWLEVLRRAKKYLDTKNESDLILKNDGVLINSGQFNGMSSEEARQKITEFVGGKIVKNYRIKDWVFARQRYWGEPIPIVHCEKCGAVAVPESELPVKLPDVENYEPSGTGESPLANIADWVNTTCPDCGGPAKRETNTMPQWAGSSWYYLRFIDPKNPNALVDKEKEKNWMPVDVYVGGDHATRHLIYARFWHKFLFDIGAVSTEEPFPRLEFLGFILANDGRKMSKRWGNIVNPDEMVDRFGADAFRLYEMFIGPFEYTAKWNTDGVVGTYRFLEKVWKVVFGKEFVEESDSKIKSLLNKTIKKVSEDIEGFNFNTAVSSMMIFMNEVSDGKISESDFKSFLKVLAPFAPHITEELYQKLIADSLEIKAGSIHLSDWPKFDEKLIVEDISITVSFNGKTRGRIEVSSSGLSEEEVLELVFESEQFSKYITRENFKGKLIFIPNKIINIITE